MNLTLSNPPTGVEVLLEASTDLKNWVDVATGVADQFKRTLILVDTNAPPGGRFYRAVLP